MAAFMVGKSLKDRRQTKAIEDLIDKADKNGNGKISVQVRQVFYYVFKIVCLRKAFNCDVREYVLNGSVTTPYT